MEPIGPRELRQQLAVLCASFANAFRPKDSNPVTAEDFLIRAETLEEQRQKQTQRMADILRAIAKPGKPKRRKRKGPK